MNRNTNTNTTVTLTDGRTMVLRHRNSLGGWANALAKAGVTVDQVASTVAGLTDVDRVAK